MNELQRMQDQVGYVVMGGAPGHHYHVGQVINGWAEVDESRHECPMVVIGFTTIDEWKEQVHAQGRPWDESLVHRYRDTQILKLRAE